jgi:hypothetical protein
MHAHHLLPLAGLALDALAPRHARGLFTAVALAYVAAWAALMVAGFTGATPPPAFGR